MKTGLIFLGGDGPTAKTAEFYAGANCIVCADSGCDTALALGITPHLVVGDMDSTALDIHELEARGIAVQSCPAQKDETDGELAVDAVIHAGCNSAVLLGALGGRLDHALGNLLLLIRLAQRGVAAKIVHDDVSVSACNGHLALSGQAGDTVSVLPFGPGVHERTHGLQYALPVPTLLPITAGLGISNIMLGEHCAVDISGGWAFIFHHHTAGCPDWP